MMAALVVAVAVVLDAILGEPPDRFHPVAWFGRLVERVDRDWERQRAAGLATALGLPLVPALAVAAVVIGGATVHLAVGLLAGAVALWWAISLRALLSTAARVERLVVTDPDMARRSLRALAGRPAGDLAADGVRSAVVESLAENLADGLVAPLLGFALAVAGAGALGWGLPVTVAAGAAAATWVSAVDALDSTIGYPDHPLGWASARLDDVVMFLPARVTAGLLALTLASPVALIRVPLLARAVDSPNAGYPMAALAVGLDRRLEKPDTYVLNEGAAPPDGAAVTRARRRTALAGTLAVVLAAVIAWV
jgi:adenosylcobinamide-phosphate synthase